MKSGDSYDGWCHKLIEVFKQYSIKDVGCSIFVLNLWLPNISSQVKFQLMSSLFASITPSSYSITDKINCYGDFKSFYEKISSNLPTFFMLEDYVPESDWGNIKFYHEENIYKIFYGNELSNVFEYLTIFQMVYCHFNKEYGQITKRQPSLELSYTLKLQDDIITGIKSQAVEDGIPDLSPGHFELPPETFWKEAASFYLSYKPSAFLTSDFLDNFSVEIGTYGFESTDYSNFADLVFEGKLLPYFFVKHEDTYLLLLPRRYSAILFDRWCELFGMHHHKVTTKKLSYADVVGIQLYKFVKSRLNLDAIFPTVSALHDSGKPHKMVFPLAFISKNKLIIVHVTSPGLSKQQVEKELADTVTDLRDSRKLISIKPLTLAIHVERKNVRFESENSAELKPVFITVIPQVSTSIYSISIPRKLPGYVMFIDSFLGIIDELDDNNILGEFLDYYEKHKTVINLPISLDVFGSFKSSYGVLVEGANEPDMISLDPHWGTILRYKTLSAFWKIYPERHFFDHPRSWKVEKETETRTRLVARGYFGLALHCKVADCHIFINSAFDKLSYEQGQITNLLMESLEDTFSRNNQVLKEHQFFKRYEQCQILLFPLSAVISNDDFKHLRHLSPTGSKWSIDYARLKPSMYGFRIVYDDKRLAEELSTVTDRSVEIDFAVNVLRKINLACPDNVINNYIEQLKTQASDKPRFKLFMIEKDVSFPEFVEIWEPESTHFKMARKIIAEQAKICGITEGYFTLDDAKAKINEVRKSVVNIINNEVLKYDFRKCVPTLLEKIDAVIDRYKRSSYTISKSLEHDVDYVREDSYAHEHRVFVTLHKNCRYLIEKFVQLQPAGARQLQKEDYQFLLALIDWLHVFYAASDCLHYGINPVGMRVSRDYLIETVYEEDPDEKEKIFAEEHAKQKLGTLGNPTDSVSANDDYKDLLNSLDGAFKQDLEFPFTCFINVLQVLSKWAVVKKGIKEQPCYHATETEIIECCMEQLESFSPDEIKKAIDFLTLKNSEVLKLIDSDTSCDDLPVWEHNKRFARYALRPLISCDNTYYWGPHSARKSGNIWSGNLSYGTLPVDIKSKAIETVLRKEKNLIEKALVMKGEEIVKRYTPYVRRNLELHKLPPKGKHPSELGDFDILAFYEAKNVIFNIECKDILPVFCLKDAKRLREKIYGRNSQDEGHFTQINRRQNYLKANIVDIMHLLNWPYDSNAPPTCNHTNISD